MRIGVLGSGVMGRQHLESACGIAGLSLVTRTMSPFNAVPRGDRRRLFAALLGDMSIDAIDICLPTSQHEPVAIAALAAGKHVLCEKPMALSTASCKRMLAEAALRQKTLMIAHVVRFFPAYRRLAEAVRTHEFGPPVRALFQRESAMPDWGEWLTQENESGGGILDLLVHDFDQVLMLFGEPRTLNATPIHLPDSVTCKMECQGVHVTVQGGWFADGRPFAMSFRVEFSEGTMTFGDGQLMLERPGHAMQEISVSNADPYQEQIRYFAECCERNEQPIACPPEASAAATGLALEVRDLSLHFPGTTVLRAGH